MIERIEVLKGGQGIFYGTQSAGGVINIVTKSLQQDEADGYQPWRDSETQASTIDRERG